MSREPEYIFFPKKTYRWPTDTWKAAQYHKSSWECKSKSQWDTTLHLSEWLLSKIQDIHCWWECKLIQPIWKMVCRFLKKLGITSPYGPRIPLLGMYPEETKIERDTCIPVFIAALFTIARTWKQTRCPSTDEWIKVVVHIYNGILLSHKKEHIWVSSDEVDEPRTYYTEWSESERER